MKLQSLLLVFQLLERCGSPNITMSNWNQITISPLMKRRLPKLANQKPIPKLNKELIPIVGVFTIEFRNNCVIVLYLFIVFV